MFQRVVVSGHSMEPTLRSGQKLLVLKNANPRIGDIVVVRDRTGERKVVKRIAKVRGGHYFIKGDAGTYKERAVKREDIVGKVLFSYSPLKRIR